MSSVQKRGRACEACSKIKIKCELGSAVNAVPPCERCVRLGKECALVAPKRQKDRVAELEAQVERLTRLLREKGISDAGEDDQSHQTEHDVDDGQTPQSAADSRTDVRIVGKKRKLDENAAAIPLGTSDVSAPFPETSLWPGAGNSQWPGFESITSPFAQDASLRALDNIVSRPVQEHILSRYSNQILPCFPLVLLPDNCTLDALRLQSPVMLLAIIYASGSGILSPHDQEEISAVLLNRLADAAIAEGNKTLELIQALQITCLWYRSPVHHRHVAIHQLVQLATGIAMDIGIGGPESSPSLGYPMEDQELECAETWRAWLTCYLLTGAMSIFMRRPNLVPWTQWHDTCAMMLGYSDAAAATDKWVVQYVRAERLCEQISDQLGFFDLTSSTDVADTSMRCKMQNCRNQILNWKALVPKALHVPTLLFWEHVATAYLHEPVLHTATNKRSFAAPYVAERLSVTDFPQPVVTPDHTTSLLELRSAVHNILDIFTALDTATLIALPGMLFASRAAYGLYILAKLYIAVTAEGNTYGTVLNADTIQLEQRIDQLMDNSAAVNTIDVRCATARILRSAQRVKDWYNGYAAGVKTSSTSMPSLLSSTGLTGTEHGELLATPWESITLPVQENADLEELFWFSNATADYGLDFLFAEPSAMDNDLMPLESAKPFPMALEGNSSSGT